jgi:hypothetical protein
MATDPNGWYLTSQALDHHALVDVLTQAMPEEVRDGFRDVEIPRGTVAEHLATELGRQGYALVQLTAEAEPTHDLTSQVDAFLARKED